MKLTAEQIARVRAKANKTDTASMLTAAVAEAAVDETAMRELALYVENESSLYPAKLQILKGLKRKIDKGTYDQAQAKRLWKFWVDQGARKYAQEFSNKGDETRIFSDDTRKKLAEALELQYVDEIKGGEHNHVESAIKILHLAVASVDEKVVMPELQAVFVDSAEEVANSWKDQSDGSAEFSADGGDWVVYGSDDDAEATAMTRVQEDMQEDSEGFNKDFMRNYLSMTDTDRRVMAADESSHYGEELSDEDAIQAAELQVEYDAAKDADDDKLQEELVEQAKSQAQEKKYDEIYEALADPIQYFVNDQGIYNEEELFKQDFITIDYEQAAEDAVTADGWAHFLAIYDGKYQTLPSGAVYYRVN